jgi:hypothetical protein
MLRKNTELRVENQALEVSVEQKDQLIDSLNLKIKQLESYISDLNNPYLWHDSFHSTSSSSLKDIEMPTSNSYDSLSNLKNISTNSTWLERYDDEGRLYYHNPLTGISLWEKPVIVRPSTPLNLIRVGDWLQQFDTDGNGYWLNLSSGTTEWSIPPPSRHHIEATDTMSNKSS